MAARGPGRPKKVDARHDYLELRLRALEKRTFKDAAALAGLPLSTWVRERLRRAAIRELEDANLTIPLLKDVQLTR